MKKIVIFGASGDTGRYFVNYCLEEKNDFEIIAVGTRKTNIFDDLGVKYFSVDITDKSSFDKLPRENIYAVVHLAGLMPARMKGYNPQRYIDVNITGTLNILDYCRLCNADRIIYSQSFGDIKDYAEKELVLKADMLPNFSFTSDHTVYVMTKNFAVDLIENYHQMYGLKSYVFRLPSIYLYSPIDHYYVDGEIRKIGYRILIDNAIAGKDIEVWGDPTRPKDMVYVKDFCQMMYKALFASVEKGHYNVGTGVGTSLLDQINGMIEVFGEEGKKSKLIMRPDKPNAPQYIMDIEPAIRDLGYEPKYDYISMLQDFKLEMNRQQNQKGRSND